MDVEAAFNTPHIIESLFKNLSVLDLCRCACVSKLWNHFSTVELNRRNKTVYFYQGLECSFHKKGHRSIQDCTMKTVGKFEEKLDLQIRKLEIKPGFCIAFANLSFLDKFELLFPSHPTSKPKHKKFKNEFDDTDREKYLKSVIRTALKKRLPPNCQVSLFVGINVINMNRHPDYFSSAKDSIPAISGYFFPELAQQILQFCTIKNYYREVFRAIHNKEIKSALVLMEHKNISYCALGLKENQKKFDVFEEGIVIPVQYASSVIPLFFGPKVETACFKIPFSNDQECEIAKKMEKNGAIAFIFQQHNCVWVSFKDFRDYFPLIPIVGLCGYSAENYEEPRKDSIFYSELIKKHANLNFGCKCLLVSIKY